MLLGLGVCAIVVAGAMRLFVTPLNHDVGVFLYEARATLDGARLYTDLVEFNPPLAVFLAVPPAYVAGVLGLPAVAVWNLYAVGLMGLSLLLCWAVLRRAGLLPDPTARWTFLLIAAVCLMMGPGYDFGQRDHLMLAMFLPYALLAASRAEARRVPLWLAVAVGLFGGVGLALKPFFVLAWLVVEGYLAAQRKGWFWRRPEALSVLGVHVAYGAVVLLLTPQYLGVARLAAQVYAAYSPGPLPMLLAFIGRAPAAWLGVLAYGLVRTTAEGRPLRRVLLLLTLSLAVVYFMQNRGFTYHCYPCRAVGNLLLTMLLLGWTPRAAARAIFRRGAQMAPAILATLAVLVSAGRLAEGWRDSNWQKTSDLGQLCDVVRAEAPHGCILVLSADVAPAFPMVNYTGTGWASRTACQWLLPAFYRDAPVRPDGTPYRPRAEMSDTEKLAVEWMVEDFARHRPDVVVVDAKPKKPFFGQTSFDYLAYYRRDPRFERLWQAYSPRGSIGVYQVYLRRPERPATSPVQPEPSETRR
jgi:hypothetical protein